MKSALNYRSRGKPRSISLREKAEFTDKKMRILKSYKRRVGGLPCQRKPW